MCTEMSSFAFCVFQSIYVSILCFPFLLSHCLSVTFNFSLCLTTRLLFPPSPFLKKIKHCSSLVCIVSLKLVIFEFLRYIYGMKKILSKKNKQKQPLLSMWGKKMHFCNQISTQLNTCGAHQQHHNAK